MIVRLTGILEAVEANSAVLARADSLGNAEAHELLIPAYLAERLRNGLRPDASAGGGVGAAATFHTLQYLEGVNQGSSFIPRTLGFGSPAEREFFELITTVKGLGNKRATRALAIEPSQIALAIAERNTRSLQELPEIGKKLAETIVLELRDKVQPLLLRLGVTPGAGRPSNGTIEAKPRGTRMSPMAEEAVIALTALGQARPHAERMVELAMEKSPGLATTDEIVSAACAVRI